MKYFKNQLAVRGVASSWNVVYTRSNLVLVLFLAFQLGYSQLEAKFNAATALLLIPNAGIELPLGARKSIQLDVLGSFWDEMPLLNDTPLHINQTFLEYRWYKEEGLEKWFFGPHIGFGMFSLQKPEFLIIYDHYEEISGGDSGGGLPSGNRYQSGRIAFYGVTIGYKKRLNKDWGLEAFLGIGLTQSKYKGYANDVRVDVVKNPKDGPFNGSSEVLPYRGGLMVVYKFPLYAGNK